MQNRQTILFLTTLVLLFSAGWAKAVGTPAGTGVNPIALSYLRELAGLEITFVQWMMLGVPAVLMMLPLGWFVLLKVFPPEIEYLPIDADEIQGKLTAV